MAFQGFTQKMGQARDLKLQVMVQIAGCRSSLEPKCKVIEHNIRYYSTT